MSKTTPRFYAVRKGRTNGVFTTWDECEAQVKGYMGAKYKKFSNAADAEAFAAGTQIEQPTAQQHPIDRKPHGGNAGNAKKRKSSDTLEQEWDIVYSDGACKGNGQLGSVAGIGIWWGENDPRNMAERCPGDQTNNRAELIAIIRLLEETPHSKKPLVIRTDSQYSISCISEWLPKWIRTSFRTSNGQPVKNVLIIKYLSALLNARGSMGQKVEFEKVKGHSGDVGNDGADALANLGCLEPTLPERDWKALIAALEKNNRTEKSAVDLVTSTPETTATREASSSRISEVTPQKKAKLEVDSSSTTISPPKFGKFTPQRPALIAGPSKPALQTIPERKIDPPLNPMTPRKPMPASETPSKIGSSPSTQKTISTLKPPRRIEICSEVDFDAFATKLVGSDEPQVRPRPTGDSGAQPGTSHSRMKVPPKPTRQNPKVAESEIDPNMYLDGLLSDDDLQKELDENDSF